MNIVLVRAILIVDKTPEKRVSGEAQNVILQCNFSNDLNGLRAVTVEWYRVGNGNRRALTSNQRVNAEFFGKSGMAFLTFKILEPDDEATYSCQGTDTVTNEKASNDIKLSFHLSECC